MRSFFHAKLLVTAELTFLVTIALVPLAAPAWGDDAGVSKDAPVSFVRQVAPVLVKNCVACHGVKEPKGDYQLQTFVTAMKAGASSNASIVPGKPENSELVRMLTETDPKERMPKDGDPLPAVQIELIKRWIAEGAKFDGPDPTALLATIIPRQPYPAPPEKYPFPLAVTAVAFSPDGKQLAVSGYREITLWDAQTGTLVRRIKNIAERTYGLAYHGSGSPLAVASGTPGQLGEVKLLSPDDGSELKLLGTMPDVELAVAFNPAGDRLAACGADRAVRIYDLATGSPTLVLEDHADWVTALAWSPDGIRIASASRDKTAKVFDAMRGHAETTFPDHTEAVLAVAFSADGKSVFSAGHDKKLFKWNAATGKPSGPPGDVSGDIYRLLMQGNQMLTCSATGGVELFDAKGYVKLERALTASPKHAYAMDWTSHGQRLAIGAADGTVTIFDEAGQAPALVFQASPGIAARSP